jgi:hypothetical protein
LEYQKLSKRLYEDLKNDNLLDKVIEYQKNDKIRTHLWSATIINMSSNLAFYPNQLIEVIDGKKLGISWPILVYSYIRDFELFFRFVVDPIVEYDPLNSTNKKNYIERFREFCEAPQKKRIFTETLRSVLKSRIRSRLAHQQYFVKVSTQEIILFKDENFPQGKDKIITFDELLNLTTNLNSFFWSVFFLVINEMDDNTDHKIVEMQTIYHLSEGLDIQSRLQDFQLLPKFDLSKIKSFLEGYCEEHPYSSSYLPDPIIESFNYHLILFKGIKPNLYELMDIQARSQYLVGYALLEEKYLKPIAKALKPQIHLGHVKDRELLDIVRNYKESKYEELFRVFNPDVRNAIAHVDYYMKDFISHYLDKGSQTMKPIGIGFLNAFQIYSDLDDVFNMSKEQVALLMGIAKFLNNIYFEGGNKNPADYQIAGKTILGLDPSEYEILFPFGVICVILSSLLTDSIKNIRKTVKEINKIIKTYTIDPIIIYASILTFAFKNDNPNQSILWVKNLIQFFPNQPNTKNGKKFVWFIKSLSYIFNGDYNKASLAYQNGLRFFD